MHASAQRLNHSRIARTARHAVSAAGPLFWATFLTTLFFNALTGGVCGCPLHSLHSQVLRFLNDLPFWSRRGDPLPDGLAAAMVTAANRTLVVLPPAGQSGGRSWYHDDLNDFMPWPQYYCPAASTAGGEETYFAGAWKARASSGAAPSTS